MAYTEKIARAPLSALPPAEAAAKAFAPAASAKLAKVKAALFLCALLALAPVFAPQALFAQSVLAPSYSVQPTKSGFVYTFWVKAGEVVRYRVFDSFTGGVTTGFALNADTLAINHNDTVTAWTESRSGGMSREITLGKNPAAEAKLEVLSPAEGTWANRQPLVLEVPAGTEVFYSLSGTDPLDFGFAYDEPVLLDLDGDVTLNLAAVASDGSVSRKTISYTVSEPSGVRPPVAVNSLEPLLVCGVRSPVPLPQNSLYSLSDGAAPSFAGRTLYQQVPSCIDSLKPLIVNSNNRLYRYVICTQDSPRTDSAQQYSLSSPIQIIDWNFVSFPSGRQIYYSVDGSSWRLYVEPFYIDRNAAHRIEWKTSLGADSLDLPAKPKIVGLPERGVTNSPVELQCSNPLYTFRIEDQNGVSKPLTSFYVDTFHGETRSFSISLAVYYGNIRQGEIPVSFTIDKEPPPKPSIHLASKGTYVRGGASVVVSSGESVYTAVDERRSYIPFYATSEALEDDAETDDDLLFVPFSGSRLVLNGDSEYAVTYTVYAYAQDAAGNKSEAVSCRVVVDNCNYYVDSNANGYGDGSPDAPFASFAEALRTVNSRDYTVLHLRGSFLQESDLQVLADARLIGHGTAVLSFGSGSRLKVRGCNFSAHSLLLEKQAANAAEASPYALWREPPLIYAENANLLIESCEIVASGSVPEGVIALRGGSCNIADCGVTLQAAASALGVVAEDAEVCADKLRFAATGEAVSAFSLSNCSLELSNVRYMLSVKRARGAELFGCTYACDDSAKRNLAEGAGAFVPVWKDSSSVEVRVAHE